MILDFSFWVRHLVQTAWRPMAVYISRCFVNPSSQNVSGALRPGVLTALLGGPGAGKTTLLRVLAGRAGAGATQGDIRVQVFPVSKSWLHDAHHFCQHLHQPCTSALTEAPSLGRKGFKTAAQCTPCRATRGSRPPSPASAASCSRTVRSENH